MLAVVILAYVACGIGISVTAHRLTATRYDDTGDRVVSGAIDVVIGAIWPLVVVLVAVELLRGFLKGLIRGPDA